MYDTFLSMQQQQTPSASHFYNNFSPSSLIPNQFNSQFSPKFAMLGQQKNIQLSTPNNAQKGFQQQQQNQNKQLLELKKMQTSSLMGPS